MQKRRTIEILKTELSTVHIVISIVWQKFIDNDVHNIYEIKSPKRKHSMRTLFVLQIVWLSKIQTKRVTVLQIVIQMQKL